MATSSAQDWSRVVPLVVLGDPSRADGLAAVLDHANLQTVEVALRTPASLDVVGALSGDPRLRVLAGTVLSAPQARHALAAGAVGLVSPGFVPQVAAVADAAGVPYVPGVATPTEALAAHAAGLRHVKYFPADRLGGTATLRAFAAALPGIRFMPSGGVTAATARDYLALPEVFAVSGTWVTPQRLVERGAWDEVAALLAASAPLWSEDE